MQITKTDIHNLGIATLNSYSQVFFSNNKVLASLLLLVSFFDYSAGVCGVVSVLTGIMLVEAMGMDKSLIKQGLYSFNNLLVGLGLGLNFQLSIELLIIVVFASLLTTFFTFALQGILGKYQLSYLSIPFLFAIWITLLATNQFSALGLSARGVYSSNELYALGGIRLLHFYQLLETKLPLSFVIYFKSLGAIFFQYHIVAGILISIGLLIYSRIMFSLSILGYLMALSFYKVFGADIEQLSYSYIGFNYILSAIAIGGYFLVPSTYSYLASVLILPMVVLLSFGFEQILSTFSISIYSLPFNLLVLMFLYALRFRAHRPTRLHEVKIHQETPEKNLYLRTNYVTRMRASGILSVSLPVVGEWTISQGYNGKYTHQGDWRHGLDFVITDQNGREYHNAGLQNEDYYCYGKNVVAPSDGYIVEVIDGIEDNAIGDIDLVHNWGNTVVIQHVIGLHSQISHLRKGSIEIKKGDFVYKGQVIGKVGSSGRSPYPHLHFQIQTAPHVGATTLDYPLSNYITCFNNNCRYHAHGTPTEGQKINNVVSTPLIANAFNFTPSQRYSYAMTFPDGKGQLFSNFKNEYTLEVHSDIYKNTYFECAETGAKAWFSSDGQIHFFSNYQGDRNSFLYYFMLALFKVELGYYQNIAIKDRIPTHFTFSGFRLFLQDFCAPFFHFLKSEYRLKFTHIDDDFTPQEIQFTSEISNSINLAVSEKLLFDVSISDSGIRQIMGNINGQIFQATCLKRAQ